MRKDSLLILSILIWSVSCRNNIRNDNINKSNLESEARLLATDSIASVRNYKIAVENRKTFDSIINLNSGERFSYWGLKGNVISMKILSEDNRFSPIVSAEFDLPGNTISVEDGEEALTYTFKLDKNGALIELIKDAVCSSYDHPEAPTTYDPEVYKVVTNKTDSFGNWTDIVLSSGETNIHLNRELEYATPMYIESSTPNKVLCLLKNYYDQSLIWVYDCSNQKWSQVLPPDYTENPNIGYSDFLVKGNNIYLILSTSAAGADAINCQYALYVYNLPDNTFKEIGYSAEGCKFVDDKIKIIHYELISGDPYYFNAKYEETIEWYTIK